jgi:hypothetical protein
MTAQAKTSLTRGAIISTIAVVLTAVLAGLKEWQGHHDLTGTAIAVVSELLVILGSMGYIGYRDGQRAAAVARGDRKALRESDVGYLIAAATLADIERAQRRGPIQ